MPETRRHYDADFKAGTVRLVEETGKSIAQVARELGINDTTLGCWVTDARRAARQAAVPGGLSSAQREELARLRKENAELRMERDVLKRSVVLWAAEATR